MGDPSIDLDPHAEAVDVSLIDAMLEMTLIERIEHHERVLETVRVLREEAVKHYGFDPRIPQTDE